MPGERVPIDDRKLVSLPMGKRGYAMDWVVAHIGVEADGVMLSGVDIWEADWRPTDEPPILLPHPSYPTQIHTFRVFEAKGVRFAACELSNGVWGFYVP